MHSIEPRFIAPIKQQWIDNVCMMVRAESFRGVPGDVADSMVDDMLNEMNELYVSSVQRSIADYVVHNANERERLQIHVTPWETAVDQRVDFVFGEW